MFSILVFSIMGIFTFSFIVYLYFYALRQSSRVGLERYSKVLELSKQYKMPKGSRFRKNNPDDYWNDAGDGSGVNYVQMPDGSVRID